MHPINKLLSQCGVQLSRNQGLVLVPPRYMDRYERDLDELKQNSGHFCVFRELHYDLGFHPDDYIDFECAFAARHIRARTPQSILDVGSYRHFILGLLASYQVTTIDVRSRRPIAGNELVITCDAKRLDLPDDSFDVALSLSALEHLGLGRYGDEFDPDADTKAFQEMVRVLKPKGHLIFTTTITGGKPSIGFNAHRIYNYNMLRAFCINLILVDDVFYSHHMRTYCSLEQVTREAETWDVYCGCWEKK